ncbi:MAG: AAA family ATPase, partial [Spirulina sp.]
MNALVNPPGYRLGQLLHTSSRTLVYRGLRDRDRVPVIVKILRNPFPTFNELVRFRNQYVIARHLEHPHIVTPLALDRYGNGYALIMPDGEGLSLRDDWRNGDRSLAEFLAIAVQLADALHYLSRQRIIHKDIKPGNVLIHPDTRQVQLIDFSIASLLPKERQQLTSPNVLEGTLAYLSPEQTGRMNRGIDYRTDFYSLGVVLYELLTGVLPFQSQDPMALIHCHIAQTPLAPHHFLDTRGKRYPEVLSEIVLKLMAKNAEDRYQSALGLKWDLQRCQQQLDATGTLARFPLGERDAGDRFLLPEKLYGREKEVRALLDAFDRVSGGAGRVEMMRVTGFSGIGKTAVVNEIHRPVVRQRGYFIKGKFDQFNRKVPFFGVLQALRDLMRQLLSESDAQLQVWKAKILAAVGENGQILINALPELQEIIGAQPPAIELSGTAARDRFHWLFQAFIGVFTTPEHPLVMFLDDLQWVDSASLNLIHLLMTELDGGSLLLVGAYRDREVSPVHSLMLVLERITRAGATIETIVLQPLSQPDINRLIADTLHCSEELAHPLADLVYRRTRGNPFFTAQFLRALYEDGAIAFDPRRGGWQCDLAKVREASLTDDVVAFMALQLQKFPEATREALKLAACIGNTFDLATLAIVCETTPEEVAGNLWHGLQEGFVLPESEIYKFFQGDEDEQRDAKSKIFSSQPDRVAYRFVHDRVQQAAYSLIPEAQKQVTHLKIGQLLLQNKPDRVRDENIFALVNHLNYGATLLTEGAERDRLARLNLMAGRRALTANAAEAAAEYLRNGRDLLPENSWELDYSLTLALYSLSVESAYLNSDFEGIEKLATLVEHRAATLLDRIKVCEIKIQARSAQNKLTEAVAIGHAVLEQLGVSFPETIAPADIENGFQAIDRHLTDAAIEALIDLPLMKDPEKRAAMLILTNIFIPVYITAPERLPLLVCQQVLLSLQYGNAPESAVAYTNYGLILCGVIGDIDKGYRFGKLGLAVLDRLHI